MGLYNIIPGFRGAPWAVGAPRFVTTFHPTSDGPAWDHHPEFCTYVFSQMMRLPYRTR